VEDFSIAPNFVEPAAFEVQLEQRKEFKRPALWDKYDMPFPQCIFVTLYLGTT